MRILFILLFPMSLCAQSDAEYRQLLSAYQDCCGIPTDYNSFESTDQPVRPMATKVDPCYPVIQETSYQPYHQEITIDLVIDKTLYFVKISAVRSGNNNGGMPHYSWRLPGNYLLGNYIASQGYEAVIMGPYESTVDATSALTWATTNGYCNAIILTERIYYSTQVKVYEKAGDYQ